ncbi:MAG: aminoacyl-tRNA hydrolase [Leptonema sp. (in: Bacteria)]|nr:aminoacyl-tRNA hydrolase [Leptonema sp. (in: bacteria)]
MTFLIVGLGNPGPQYRLTRHNAGFIFVDRFAESCKDNQNDLSGKVSNWKEESGGYLAEIRDFTNSKTVLEQTILLFKPLSFMNQSGRPVVQCAKKHKIPPKNWLVLHDEIDLPLLDVRLKIGGGHRGHNGLRDIMSFSGTGDFARIRIGVDRPVAGPVADYVLSKFESNETSQFDTITATVNRLASEWLQTKKSETE